ncbi:MAG: hypothetical protein MI750_12790 [Xanthomonadales bacterium]|nr:hypothetical protein [Xanthomonadales bacterium]
MVLLGSDGSSVHSNQQGVHEQLHKTLERHRGKAFQKPIAEHTKSAFEAVQARLNTEPDRPLVLDSGCGVGESTQHLAQRHPKAWVIGIDKSAHRLGKSSADTPKLQSLVHQQDNALWVRADLIDFWRLAQQAQWRPTHHYLLYPNPWPKSEHLQRRWHGHSIFATILALGGRLELRSNWRLYVEEFHQALRFYEIAATPAESFTPTTLITPFERKYTERGEPLYRLTAVLPTDFQRE